MFSVVFYEEATGRVLYGLSGTDASGIPVEEGIEALSVDTTRGLDYDTIWVNPLTGELETRPVLPVTVSKMSIVANDTDECVISGLPDPVSVMIDGVKHTVEGGSLTLTSSMPATYTIQINHFPYLPFQTEIIANAPDAE